MTWLERKWMIKCSLYEVELHGLPLKLPSIILFLNTQRKKKGIIHARHVWKGKYYGHQSKNCFLINER